MGMNTAASCARTASTRRLRHWNAHVDVITMTTRFTAASLATYAVMPTLITATRTTFTPRGKGTPPAT
jgi:hypothetical protein